MMKFKFGLSLRRATTGAHNDAISKIIITDHIKSTNNPPRIITTHQKQPNRRGNKVSRKKKKKKQAEKAT